ncbi:MAG: glycosyltransferase [Pelagimonas sp.]|uniref:glycosyltransferase n=1 Tax=Pelagimonas sp. TaxID=2073170 RepID=UPI003D6BBC8B
MSAGQLSAGRLVAVMVTYNRLDQLKVSLARLLDSAPDHLQAVVVVDNASTDGTEAWLAEQTDPRLVVFRSAHNGGGAGGFDQGMRLAAERFDPDWLVVMDDDARPAPDALARFHAKCQSGDLSGVDAVAAAVYHPDDRICDMNRPWTNPFWHRDVFLRTLRGGREGFHLGRDDYDTETGQRIDGGSFVGLFLSRRGREIGGYPDPSLFIYGDDVLYTLRLTRAGGHIRFDPQLRFEHDFSTLTDGVQRFRPMWKCYFHHRNLLMIYREAAGLWFWLVLPLVALKWIAKFRHYGDERGTFLRLVARALRDGLLRRTTADLATVKRWTGEGQI